MRRHSAKTLASASHSRAGLTLMEALVTTTLLMVLSGSACMLITRMLQANRSQTVTLARQRALHMWQAQFVQDGRIAQSARIEAATPETLRIEFQRPEGAVTYQVIPDGLERLVDGKLGGRWDCGRGVWDFSLQDRIVRAKFRQAVELPMSSRMSPTLEAQTLASGSVTCVDVAIGTGSFLTTTPGAP